MATPPLEKSAYEPIVRAVAEARAKGHRPGSSPSDVQAAAESLGMAYTTARRHLAQAAARFGLTPENVGTASASSDDAPVFPDLPEGDIPPAELIDIMSRRFEKRRERQNAEKWVEIKVPSDGPFAVCWFGDPHLDSNGCNWPVLKQHIEIVSRAKFCYGANIGDVTDNWVGRLLRLYADSDTSRSTAWRLAEWFLKDCGVNWLIWLLGNHDLWNQGKYILRALNDATRIPMFDWGAQFVLSCGDAEWRIWASHDFPGHSMWNSLHGPQKAAHMKEMADLYVCGHKHNWAVHQEESGSRGFSYWLVRAAGYKHQDDYSERLGHFQQQRGSSVVSVFDPASRLITCFPDVEEGVDYLRFRRRRK